MAFHQGMPRTARYRMRLCRCASVGSHTSSSNEVPAKTIAASSTGWNSGWSSLREIVYRRAADGIGVGAKVVPRSPRLYASTALGRIVSSHPSRLQALLSTLVRLHICRSRGPPRTTEEVGLLISTSAIRFMDSWRSAAKDGACSVIIAEGGPYTSTQEDEISPAVSAGEPDRYDAAATKKVLQSIDIRAPT